MGLKQLREDVITLMGYCKGVEGMCNKILHTLDNGSLSKTPRASRKPSNPKSPPGGNAGAPPEPPQEASDPNGGKQAVDENPPDQPDEKLEPREGFATLKDELEHMCLNDADDNQAEENLKQLVDLACKGKRGRKPTFKVDEIHKLVAQKPKLFESIIKIGRDLGW